MSKDTDLIEEHAIEEIAVIGLAEGLSRPLDQFDVLFAPSKQAALLVNNGASDESSRWLL